MKADPDLETLTLAYLDGSLDSVGARKLNELLAADREARVYFSEALNLDSAIAALAAGWQEPVATVKLREPSRRRFPRFAMVAALIALLAGSWVWWGRGWRDGVSHYATVERGLGVQSLPDGMILGSEVHAITAGTVELRTASDVHLIIEAPAEFRFESPQRLHLNTGRLTAEVPPEAKGFAVLTPTGDAIDLGTCFGVDVSEEGGAEIHVFEGEVIAKTNGTAESLSLRAGDALLMNSGASMVRELRSSAFIQHDEMRELRAGPGMAQRSHAEAVLDELRKDPAKIAVLDFESNHPYPGVYRKVQGRWPGSHAPEFIHPGDHLKLNVGGERTWPRLTLAAWVRLDQLGALYQSLLHADGWEEDDFGLVHWMVNDATTMRFAMSGNILAPGSAETQAYPDSRTPVAPDQGRWVHLATVYDSTTGTVRFYHNGRLDKVARQSTAYPARLGAMQIGNWNREERKLSGRVDELVILGRAMSDEEIRILFEVGNPYPQIQ